MSKFCQNCGTQIADDNQAFCPNCGANLGVNVNTNTNTFAQQQTNVNNNQKSKLNNVYYCDTYNGIGQSNFSCGWDCIHYDNSTYLKIYNYVINNCSF